MSGIGEALTADFAAGSKTLPTAYSKGVSDDDRDPARPPAELPRRRTDDILTTLADRLGERFTASTVSGPPVESEAVTIIPVAIVRLGLGGGAARTRVAGEPVRGRRRCV